LRPSFSFDVVFIDGLHTHQQVLKDIDNALAVLTEGGVILVHDCNPPDAVAAYPAESAQHVASLNIPGWNGDWCGDVWKAVVLLRSSRHDLRVFVLNTDYGIGVIRRATPEDTLDVMGMDISAMTYKDLAGNRERFLSLRKPESLEELLG
jgi:hypothetical protein